MDWREVFWLLAPLPTNISAKWLRFVFLRNQFIRNLLLGPLKIKKLQQLRKKFIFKLGFHDGITWYNVV